jgi:S-adenosylmethionine uptake transporter
MAYYSSLVYLVISFILAPLAALVGEIPDAHPSIAFLFRTWSRPTLLDWAIMAGLGLVWAGGMYFVARAYTLAPASVVAPFEYAPLLINLIWGFLLWQEFPTLTTLVGAFLTVCSGIYILYRERARPNVEGERPEEPGEDILSASF